MTYQGLLLDGPLLLLQDLEITRGYVPGYHQPLGHEFVGVVETCSRPQLVGKRVVGEINCNDAHFSCANAVFQRNHAPGRSVETASAHIVQRVAHLRHAKLLSCHCCTTCHIVKSILVKQQHVFEILQGCVCMIVGDTAAAPVSATNCRTAFWCTGVC
jgi:hypothetical protein